MARSRCVTEVPKNGRQVPTVRSVGSSAPIAVRVIYSTSDVCVVLGMTSRGIITTKNALVIPRDMLRAGYTPTYDDVLQIRCTIEEISGMGHPASIVDCIGNKLPRPYIFTTYKVVKLQSICYPDIIAPPPPLHYVMHPDRYIAILTILVREYPSLIPILNSGIPCDGGYRYTVLQTMTLFAELGHLNILKSHDMIPVQ